MKEQARTPWLDGRGEAIARILQLSDVKSKSGEPALRAELLICTGELKGERRALWFTFGYATASSRLQELFAALDCEADDEQENLVASGGAEGRHVFVRWYTPKKHTLTRFERATPEQAAQALQEFPWSQRELSEDDVADMARTFVMTAEWSRLTSERDNRPTRRPMKELLAMLAERRITSEKRGVPMLMPVTHKTPEEGGVENRGGWRVAANALDSYLLTVDIDDKPPERIAAFCEAIEREGLAHLITSSFSHSAKKAKCHIVFPLSRGVAPAEYTDLFWKIDTMSGGDAYGGILDENCRFASFQFYAPSCPPAQLKHAFSEWHPGKPLDPDAWAERRKVQRIKQPKREPSQDIDTSELDRLVPLEKRMKAFQEWLVDREPEIMGISPQKFTFRTFQNAKGFGLTLAQAMPYMREYDARCVPPWGEKLENLGADAYTYSDYIGFGSRWADFEGSVDDDPIIVSNDWPSVLDRVVGRLAQRMEGKLFQRGGELVTVGIADDGSPEIIDLNAARLQDIVMRHSPLWKNVDDELQLAIPEMRFIDMLAARRCGDEIPVLLDLCPRPTLRQDGTLLSAPGYDSASRLYLIEGQDLALGTTQKDAQDAAQELLQVVELTAFDEISRSVWLSFVLTLACRNFIDGSIPGFASDAPAEGSGKGLVVHAAHMITTGRKAIMQPFPSRDEKLEGEVFAAARSGVQLLTFDNLERLLEGSALESAMTSERIRSRKFHNQIMIDAPFRCVVVVTGNNIDFGGTTHRRFVTMTQTPGASPHLRHVDDPRWGVEALMHWITQKQKSLLAAALTIVKAYADSGDKVETNPFGGFECWASRIAAALVWAGQPDPIRGNVNSSTEPLRDLVRALLAWQESRKQAPFYAKDLYDYVCSSGYAAVGHAGKTRDALRAGLEAVHGKPLSTSRDVGYVLRKLRNTVVEGAQLRGAEDRDGVLQWQIAASPDGGNAERAPAI